LARYGRAGSFFDFPLLESFNKLSTAQGGPLHGGQLVLAGDTGEQGATPSWLPEYTLEVAPCSP